MKRMLRLETLEQRQLMASDVAPFHNSLIPNDVNGDFSISPLDALVIINKLNAEGSGSLANKGAPTDRSELIDVDGDNSLSPLDALSVINTINRGEGEVTPLVEVQYHFFSVNADGSVGAELPDKDPSTPFPDVTIGVGDRVIVRTQMKDLRTGVGGAPLPTGIFSAYHDMTYTNADGKTSEELQLQWGEFDEISIKNNVRGGTFRLTYGSETTNPISVGFTGGFYDSVLTASNIKSAIEALPSIGAGNVKVSELTGDANFRFGVSFVGSLAAKNIVDPVIASNNLNDGGTGVVTLSVTGQATPDPINDSTARAARNHDLDNGKFQNADIIRYTNGPSGVQNAAVGASRTMTLLGGFSNQTPALNPQVASRLLNVVDVMFKGVAPGTINFTGDTSPLPTNGQSGNNLGIALYNAQAAYLTSSVVVLPKGNLIIADRLTAVTDLKTVAEDSGATTIDVTTNDLDRFGTSRSVTAVTQPALGGSVTFSGTNVVFTPAADFNGTAVFTYTVRNNVTPTPDTAIGTVTVTVTPVNDPPKVIKTQFTVAEDPAAPLVISPTDIFSPGPADEASQALTLSNITGVTNGLASFVGGNINFIPAPNFSGNAVIIVTGTDTGTAQDPAKSTVATITVAVTPVNDAPVPFSGTLTVAEDNKLVLIGTGAPQDLIINSNPGPLEPTQTVSLVSISATTAQGGSITTVGGITTYTPAANFFGTDSFTYTITDNGTPPATATATVTINVTPVNDGPVAVNDTGSAKLFAIGISTTPTTLNPMVNDNAGPLEINDTITLKSVTATSLGGTVTISTDKTRVIYTPPANSINKTDTFSYTIQDIAGLTATANVEVFIFPPILPFAVDDSLTVLEDAAATNIDVILNDLVNDLATKQLVSFTQPANGMVTLDNNGTPTDSSDDELVYTPPANFFGTTSFTYQLLDTKPGSNPSTGTVNVIVQEVNDPPVATDKSFSGTEDTVLTILASDVVNGLSKGPNEDAQILRVTGATLLTAGSGVLSQNAAGDIIYTPAKDFNGQALIRYTVTDNGTTAGAADPKSASATLSVNVLAVNDPPIAVGDNGGTTAENVPLTIDTNSLLANDSPGPANESTQNKFIVPITGTLTTANGGTVTQQGTNFVYTPKASFNGVDTFTYQITDDGTPPATATGTVTVTVTEVNDAPVATPLTREAFASVSTTYDFSADLAQMSRGPANESGQTLRITKVTLGANPKGTVVLNANGTVTYTAPLGTSGSDVITYEVTDNGTTNGVADLKTASSTLTVNISPFLPSTIAGHVYVDDDRSGTYDHGSGRNELTLGGVEVTLIIPATSTTSATSRTVLTKADGSYSFDSSIGINIAPGTYLVQFAVPEFTIDSPLPNGFVQTVVAPGGLNVNADFAVLGIQPGFANILENLASSYYATNATASPNQGLVAEILPSGGSAWTNARDTFKGADFQEVVLSNDSRTAYITEVRGPNHDVYTATVERRNFVVVSTPDGGKLVRILARHDELVWQAVSIASPPVEIRIRSNGYLLAVDDFFAGQNW